MKERLKEILQNHDYYAHCEGCTRVIKACENCRDERLADHLLANGVIVPPCKVGDTLWVQWGKEHGLKEKVFPVEVYALRFDTKKNNMRICVEGVFEVTAYGGKFNHYYNGTFAWNSIGKTVFLTEKDAERTLAERSRQ